MDGKLLKVILVGNSKVLWEAAVAILPPTRFQPELETKTEYDAEYKKAESQTAGGRVYP